MPRSFSSFSALRTATAAFGSMLALVLVLASCSSGTGGADDNSASSSKDATGSCAAQAQAIVDAAKRPSPARYPASFDARSVAGKKFWLISVSNASPAIQTEVAGFTAAATAAGAKAQVFDGKGSPDLYNQGVNTAVAQHAAGILLLGLDPALVKSAVARAGQDGIPVVDAIEGAPDGPLLPGVVAHVTYDAHQEGTLQGAYAAAASGCRAHTIIFYSQASPATTLIAQGAQDELKSLCPDSCSADLQNVDAATFATQLTTLTQSLLQRSPDVNYLITTTDTFVSYIGAAAKALGKNIPIIGASGATLAAAQQGADNQVADVLFLPLPMAGWVFFDAMMRATEGRRSNVTYGFRLVDKSNWGTGTSDANLYPDFTGYQAKFNALWGRRLSA